MKSYFYFPPLVRALGLQVSEGGGAGRRRRNYHSYDAIGGLSVPGAADLEHWRAVRIAGGRRTAQAVRRLDVGGRGAGACRTGRLRPR